MNRRAFLTSATAFTASLAPLGRRVRAIRSIAAAAVDRSDAAGGAIEPYARLLSEHMAKTLARVVIVEHKPGASTMLAAQFAANAPPDGNMILIGTQGMIEIIPTAVTNSKWSMDDFIPLIRGVTAPLVLVTNPGVPARTLPELVAWIRESRQAQLFVLRCRNAIALPRLSTQRAVRPRPPPRTRARIAAQSTDLMGGHVLFGFTQHQTALPLIRDGKLNAIAVTGATRSRFLPEVPTMAELGHPEFTARVWFGLMVRSGTPSDVVADFLKAAKAAHVDPDVRGKLETQGYEVSGETGPEFAADIRAQIERWARLVKAAGFKAD